MISRNGEPGFRRAAEDAFFIEMSTGKLARLASVAALCLFLVFAVSPRYGSTFAAAHLLLYAVLFVLCARGVTAVSERRKRLLTGAVAVRTLLALHACWTALDLRFAHQLRAEGTLLVTASLVLAALQAQPNRVAYLIGLFPPVACVVFLAFDRPIEEARTGVAMLLLLGVIMTAAIRQNGLAKRAHQLQVRSDSTAQVLSEALSVADLAEEVAQIGHWRNGPGNDHAWSPGVFRIFGLEPADHPPSLKEALTFYTPHDRVEIAALLADAKANRRGFQFEHALTRRDGSVRQIAVKARWASGDAAEGGWLLGVAQDVTDGTRSRAGAGAGAGSVPPAGRECE